MYLYAAAVSHTGTVREKNEDSFCVCGRVFDAARDNGRRFSLKRKLSDTVFLGLFDGMGGMSAGDKASQLAAYAAKEACLRSELSPIELMQKVCNTANSRICAEMIKQQKRIGSTAAMLAFKEDKFTLCNIGDSPIMLFRNNTLSSISVEHTEKTEGHGGSEKKKPRLTQYLGIFPQESIIAPYLSEGRIYSGDRFLICSDGLSDAVSGEDIAQIMSRDIPIKKLASQLLDKAIENKSSDNITIIAVHIA